MFDTDDVLRKTVVGESLKNVLNVLILIFRIKKQVAELYLYVPFVKQRHISVSITLRIS